MLHLVCSNASFTPGDSAPQPGSSPASAESLVMYRALKRANTRIESMRNNGCAVCGQTTSLVCEGCLIERYCSRQCQKKGWAAEHRRLCGPTKQVHAQLIDNNLLELSFMDRRQKKVFTKTMASTFADVYTIKEPSLKNNGKPRGKQLRCTVADCDDPTAVGLRYVDTSTGRKKSCVCASCWIPFLKEFCDAEQRKSEMQFYTDPSSLGY